MRELKLVREESTDTSLVLVDEHGGEYFLAVDDTLTTLFPPATSGPDGAGVTVVDESAPTAPADSTGTQGAQAPAASELDGPQDGAAEAAEAKEDQPAAEAPEGTAEAAVNEPAQPAQPVQPAKPAQAAQPVQTKESEEAARRRSLPTPDPLYSAPLTLRPREIQMRIRAGASAQELADEMGVAVSRVEAYAHPVILERTQIAQLARASHPVRENGPATLTLSEVLAAAFGARGHSLSEATWDAFREPDGEWVVRVTWQAGLSENVAEWILRRHSASSATTEPRNAIAADLTDPDFVQPVRSLTSISRGARYDEPMPSNRDDRDDRDDDELADERDDAAAQDADVIAEGEEVHAESDATAEEEVKPTKRRRKAVTPHWEDVLLGVRTNTKRPKN